MLFIDWMMKSKSCYNVIRIWHFYKHFQSGGVRALKIFGTNLQICFLQHISDAMIGFLCFIGIQYMIGSVFFFFCDFKIQTFSIFCVFIDHFITAFISFAVSVISMCNKAHLIQYHFNLIHFTYNNNIVTCFIKKSKNKFFWSDSRQLMMSIYFRIGLNLGGLILVLDFEIILSIFVKMTDFQGIKDSSDILLSDNNSSLIILFKPLVP